MTQSSAAVHIEPVDPAASADQRRALAALLLAARNRPHRPAADPAPAVPRDRDSYPCSSQQRRIWLASRIDADGVAMPNATAGIRLRGPLDPAALAAALTALTARHEALRTVFWPDGPAGTEPRQRILPTVETRLDQVDLSGLPPAERDTRAQALAATATGERFDLATGPLFRVTRFRFGPDEHALLLVCHHIVMDEQSVDLVLADLARLYAARRAGTADPPPPARQYVDYAAGSADAIGPEVRQRRQHWWRTRLAGPRPELELPFAAPGGHTRAGASETAQLPPGVLDRLRQAGGGATTPFVALLTVLKLLLVRYTGQPDLTVGTITAGRDRTVWEPVVGCFLDLLALRTDLTGATTFAAAAARVRAGVAGAFTHQLPFDEVVALANPDRSRRTHPLFPVAFTMMSERTGYGPWPDLAVEVWHHRVDPGGLDLTVEATPAADGSVRVVFKHRPDEFEPGAVAQLARHFETLAGNLAADPTRPLDRVSMLPAAELAELRALGAGPTPPVPGTVLDQFRRQAQATPDATAVISGDTRLSYRELLTAAEELAGRLRRAGAGRGALVAICLDRSAELVVAPLAVWAAGGAWVPVDPEYPADRQAFVIADAGAAVVLTRRALADQLPAHDTTVLCLDDPTEPETTEPEAVAPPRPGDAAYVLYTSGSTGRPKGVVVNHHNLTNFILAMGQLLDSAPAHRWLAVTSLAFDIAGLELWLPLVTGSRLVMVPDAVVRDGRALAALVATHRVSHVQTTPSTWRLLLAGGLRPGAGLVGLVGGEALPLPLARELRAVTGRLVNVYGPTETTIWSTTWEVPDPVTDVTIGAPIANTQVYVHDGYGELVPRGVPGELCIGGDGVATGYLNRPALTATRFVPDPYGPPGSRLYRTGDRVRWRGDGTLEFLGRIDHQVKIRGYRIEPGEIEARLLEHPHINQAAVVVRPDPAGEPSLVGYLVTTDGTDPDPRELRAFLSGTLPAYMVPPHLLRLDALPLTPNRKLNRAALPDPPRSGTGAGRVPLRTSTEYLVARVWAQVLGLAEVSADDDFFDLGGHSLLALRVMAALSAELGYEVAVPTLFAHPTVAGLAAVLAADVPAVSTAATPVRHRPAGRTELPLAAAQERIWFLDQVDPGTAAYNIYLVYRLRGPLDARAVVSSIQDLVDRHESLRTRFQSRDGVPVQLVDPPGALPVEQLDLSGLPEGDREARARRLVAERTNAPFDLAAGWPVRPSLIRLDDQDHVLCLVLHHIAADGVSLGIIARELRARYQAFRAGTPDPLPPLAIGYGDYTCWQRSDAGAGAAAALAYWRRQLAAPPVLDLPVDAPRVVAGRAVAGHERRLLDTDLATELERLARTQRGTMFMVLLAAYQALLGAHSGQPDLLVGSPIAGRTRPELEPLVGYLTNILVLRADLSGDPTFRELLDRTREVVLAAYAHQDAPLEQLVTELDLPRDLSRNPLFQTMLVWHSQDSAGIELFPGVATEFFEDGFDHTIFDLSLQMRPEPEGLSAAWTYDRNLFAPERIATLARRFDELLRAVAADPDRPLSHLLAGSPAEARQLAELGTGPATTAAGPVVQWFADQVAATPDAPALRCGDQRLSYRELDQRVDRLARVLRARGVARDTVVGVYLPRTPELVVTLLAVWRAGGAYLPLDPCHPPARVEQLVHDSGAAQVVTTRAIGPAVAPERQLHLDDLAGLPTVAGQLPPPRPDDLAYVIYTSGSTGAPKGVAVPHRAVAARVGWMREHYRIGPADRVLQHAAVSFDTHVEEVFPCLAAGGELVLAPDGVPLPDFLDSGAGADLTVLDLPTPYWHELVGQLEAVAWPAGLRLLVIGADQAHPAAVAAWRTRFGDRVELLNTYGPTETTVIATSAALGAADATRRPPIGRPVAGTRVYVCDDRLRQVPLGAVGELCIGGDGVATGYLNRPALTATRFVPDPYGPPGSRLYRTGDRVRWRGDGTLEFLGRIDHQVKIRGYRIEPGEIEARLLEHPHINQAAVVVRPDPAGEPSLVGYLVGDAEPRQVRAFLADRLPAFLVPADLVQLDALPLTPHGKLDRAALPVPQREAAAYVPPRTEAEELVAQVWGEVLAADRVGADDDFFHLGGHSLLAVRVIARLRAAVGLTLPVRLCFQHPTVAGLAAAIEERVLTEIGAMSAPEADQILTGERRS